VAIIYPKYETIKDLKVPPSVRALKMIAFLLTNVTSKKKQRKAKTKRMFLGYMKSIIANLLSEKNRRKRINYLD
jgi:hypothetical protein